MNYPLLIWCALLLVSPFKFSALTTCTQDLHTLTQCVKVNSRNCYVVIELPTVATEQVSYCRWSLEAVFGGQHQHAPAPSPHTAPSVDQSFGYFRGSLGAHKALKYTVSCTSFLSSLLSHNPPKAPEAVFVILDSNNIQNWKKPLP